MDVDKNLLLTLLEAAMSADYTRLRRAANQLSKQYLDAQDTEAAKAIQTIIRKKGVPLRASGYAEALPMDTSTRLPLIEEGSAPASPILLDEGPGQIIAQFIEDAQHHKLLAEAGVDSPIRLLLFGKPGTGKSLLASHVAARLDRPIYVARLDSLISSRLGDTAKNIRGIFDFIPTRNAVLFLDEMDAVAKLRDDRQELGELKRVVNAVLQGLDSLSNDVVVIGATNHPHLLDPAIFRRFTYKVELTLPGPSVREAMWEEFLFGGDKSHRVDAKTLARASDGLSGADIENISLSARRRAILDKEELSLGPVFLALVGSRAGSPSLIDSRKMTKDDRRDLIVKLHTELHLPVADAARVVGISRQMAHRYLKNDTSGDSDG